MAKKEPRSCECGCGEMTKGGRFRPGHDARMHGKKHESTRIAAAMKAHAKPTEAKEETAYRRPRPSTGDGPPCPLERAHGRLLRIQGVVDWFCPHAGHGGNGRFFTADEADGRRAPDPDKQLPKAERKRDQ